MLYRSLLALALALPAALVACGGSVAPEVDPAPVPPADAGCEAATVDEWCSLVARGGTSVDPRADRCCSRWVDEALPRP